MSNPVAILKAIWKAEEAVFSQPKASRVPEELIARAFEGLQDHEESNRAFKERLSALKEARSSSSLEAYRDHYGIAGIKRFQTSAGKPVYRIVAETFPNHINNLYFLPQPQGHVLIDAATTTDTALRDLKRAERLLPEAFGQPFCIDGITDIVLTHGHIDHFGGLHLLTERSKARVYVHELDIKSIAQFEERTVLLSKELGVFLRRAGVPDQKVLQMEEMYRFGKAFFKDFEPYGALREGLFIKDLLVIHTPGHCPGEVCLKYDDILFTGDHILPTITPHQSPERIAPFCGLGHYIHALKRILGVRGIRLGLGGHEGEITDVPTRVRELLCHHQERLLNILTIFKDPKTTAEMTQMIYPMYPEGYNHLLALEEIGAHVEYLHDYGFIRIQNLEDLLNEENPSLCFQRTPKGEAFLEKPRGILEDKQELYAF